MRYCLLCLSLLLSPLAAFAEDASWQQIKNDGPRSDGVVQRLGWRQRS
ncbi:Uncharacterised protein [Citrobacter braakii]|nr:Uncharacterised protein [Citrobacter braakii]